MADPAARWRRLARPRLGFGAAYACYQVLALAMWWRALADGLHGGATVTLPRGSADPGQEVWFLGWLPHALGSGVNPLFSHAVFWPSGVNLLANTSTELVGLIVSPVTVTAGPVAGFWAAALLAPALSALGAFVLCRRHVRWQPAAFLGGLCYGFGPFAATDLRYGHLDLTWLVLPPLVFVCLDELLLRRPRRPALTGAVLGLLVVAQFFVSTELLAITAVTAAVGVLLAALARPGAVAAALRAGGTGLLTACAVASALLAYPVWVAVAGPRHFTGAVWSHIGSTAASLASTVEPHGQLPGVGFVSGGNGTFLGVGLLAVLALSAVLLRRSVVLRISLLLGAVAYVLSLGYRLHVGRASTPVPLPAALLGHVPLLDSILPSRFAAMTDLFCGVALALVVDRLRHAGLAARSEPVVDGASVPRPEPPVPREAAAASEPLVAPAAAVAPGPAPARTGRARALLAAGAAAVALVPMALVHPWPYATSTIRRPAVVASLGAAPLRPGWDVVVYPGGAQAVSNLMVWQAQEDFAFTLPNGYAIVPGPERRAVESPPVNALWLVFAAAELHRLALPLSASARRAVRADLAAMRADELVILPGDEGSRAAEGALRSVLGAPRHGVGGAALWLLSSHR